MATWVGQMWQVATRLQVADCTAVLAVEPSVRQAVSLTWPRWHCMWRLYYLWHDDSEYSSADSASRTHGRHHHACL